MDEILLNDYSLLMNLTIRSLEKRDFGGYICKSSNALGKAEGTVRLRGECSRNLTNVSNRPRFIIIFSEVDIPLEPTSTATTPKYIDTKPRKTMSKEKPKKYKHLKKKDPLEFEEELTTAVPNVDVRTHGPTQTSMPILKKEPQWIYRSGADVVNVEWGIFGGVIILNAIWQL